MLSHEELGSSGAGATRKPARPPLALDPAPALLCSADKPRPTALPDGSGGCQHRRNHLRSTGTTARLGAATSPGTGTGPLSVVRLHYYLSEERHPISTPDAGAGRPALGRQAITAPVAVPGPAVEGEPFTGGVLLSRCGAVPATPSFGDPGPVVPRVGVSAATAPRSEPGGHQALH